MTLVYLPAFDARESPPHGGTLRTRQITSDLLSCRPIKAVLPISARGYVPGDETVFLRAKVRWRLSWGHAVHYLRFHRALRHHRAAGMSVCVYEHQAGLIRLGALAALDLGFKIVGIPHNLESIAAWNHTDPVSGKCGVDYFAWELALLGRMERVLTISQDEFRLLRNVGIDANYYPYFPDREAEQHAAAARLSRSRSLRDGPLVVLGSALNEPTREGMMRIVAQLLLHGTRPIVLAGRGVTSVATRYASPRLSCFDDVSEVDLQLLLANASCACVHQERGAGSLTRIRHLLLSGVPVVCNLIAARDYAGEPGTFVYEHLSQAPELCEAAAGQLVSSNAGPSAMLSRTLQELSM